MQKNKGSILKTYMVMLSKKKYCDLLLCVFVNILIQNKHL